MVFSTHSFSPFGIAGFRPIVGEDIANGAYGDGSTPTPTPTTTPTTTPAASKNNTTTSGTGNKTTTSSGSTSSSKTAKTGDPTNIFEMLGLAVASLGTGGFALKRRKRNKK